MVLDSDAFAFRTPDEARVLNLTAVRTSDLPGRRLPRAEADELRKTQSLDAEPFANEVSLGDILGSMSGPARSSAAIFGLKEPDGDGATNRRVWSSESAKAEGRELFDRGAGRMGES